MGALRALFLLISSFAVAWPASANADELVMPFACVMDRGSPRLSVAEPTTYQILGVKKDMPFSACLSGRGASCETMMVHKFSITCGDQKVAWAKVAAAGADAGVELPPNLPAGFAPVSRFKGRFVLPGFGRTTRLPKVETQVLSAESVIETGTLDTHAEGSPWITAIDPAIRASAGGSGGAFRIAGVISTLLVSLMAACLFFARRRMPMTFEFARAASGGDTSPGGSREAARRTYAGLADKFRQSCETWFKVRQRGDSEDMDSTAFDKLHARIVDTDLLVATLPSDLLLRDVLQTELDALRGRTADLSRRAEKLGRKRVDNVMRAMHRDLDRITRIVHGTSRKAEVAGHHPADVPATVFEAYRVLGLNPDAPPMAIKKVVDALRMSWHPDHARSEADRQHREDRIKQINAAWDLLKGSQAAAI